jgi:hypothetical protein
VNPSVLLAAMLAAVHAQHSVHYVSTTTSGTTKVVIVADVAQTTGTQQITFTQAGKTGHVSVRVVNNTAYFRGDAFALRAFMGVPDANAQRYGGNWVRVPRTAKQYVSVADDVTLPSFAASLGIDGTVTKIKGGLSITTPTGGVKLLLGPNHLPTRETAKATGGTLAMTASRWNEPVHVDVPAKTVPVREVFHRLPGA